MNCKWCHFKEEYLILKKYKYWNLSLAESQILLGWSHASLKRHILFFEELRDEELIELKQVVSDWKKAVNASFHPDWFNVMQQGNMTKHLHFQLVPRYKEKLFFAGREFIDATFGRPIPDKWIVEDETFLTDLVNYLKSGV